MSSNLHTHGNAPPHEHADATAGHTHDAQGNVVAAAGTGFEPTPPTAAPAGTTAAPAAWTTAAAPAAHAHPGAGDHTHADDAPGHTHDAPPQTGVEVGPTGSGLAARVIFTLLGAAGLIAGAFLSWAFGDPGANIEYAAFYDPEGVQAQADLVTSAGGVTILLGILALLGLVFRTGWLTTLAGVLGIVAFALVLITIFRVDGGLGDVEIGLWLVLAGGVLCVIGGFFGARPRVVSRTY
jgi:hypothetical protein